MALRWRTSWTRTWRRWTRRSRPWRSPRRPSPSGPVELIEEVSDGKINGEENRYSHTDLSDFDANQLGAKQAYGYFAPIVRSKDKTLATALDQGFAAVEASLTPYEISEGIFKPYSALTAADKTVMKSRLASLAEDLARVPAAIGVS